MTTPKHAIWLAIAAMLVSSLACNTIMGGQTGGKSTLVAEFNVPTPTPDTGGGEPAPTEDTGEIIVELDTPTPASETGGESVDTEFPMPDDAFTITVISDEQLNFQTSMPMSDVPDYYRAEFTAQGYTERTLLTVIGDAAINMVFDGHASGKAIVMQAVDLGGSTNINIRLEALP